MRIVGGNLRHRTLIYPDDNVHIRPTKDRIREAIFSALGDITNYVSLDLYAGSGSMGIESLSRGSSFCYFCDISPVAKKTVNDNLKNLNIMSSSLFLFMKDEEALSWLKANNIKVDLVFLDPPYKLGEYQKIIKLILDQQILSSEGIIVTESNYHLDLDETLFSKRRDYKYGEILVSILRR